MKQDHHRHCRLFLHQYRYHQRHLHRRRRRLLKCYLYRQHYLVQMVMHYRLMLVLHLCHHRRRQNPRRHP
jgi:hypothetical protein